MKIYKYLSLNTCIQEERFPHILKTGEIGFSNFHAPGDPVEGIYYTYASEEIKQLFASEKNNTDAQSAESPYGRKIFRPNSEAAMTHTTPTTIKGMTNQTQIIPDLILIFAL